MARNQQVGEIGEQGLLNRLQQFCPPEIVGDDAAILTVQAGHSLVVTTDVLVDGVHFSVGIASPGVVTTTPADVGWRAAAVNLSDLAAMGASPLGVTVGLGLRSDLSVAWVEQLYCGLQACLQTYNTVIVGGDVCRSSVVTVAIAAFGQVLPDRVIRRSAARPGDAIVATGVQGASRAGLELLLTPEAGDSLRTDERTHLIQAHQRPFPRLDILPILWKILETDREIARPIAGMDSSDGLADAVIQICRASRVGAQINRDQIPMPPVFEHWLSPEQALEWALYGGEDFELVLCLPGAIAAALVERLGDGAAVIGTVTAELEIKILDSTGQQPEYRLDPKQRFQHF